MDNKKRDIIALISKYLPTEIATVLSSLDAQRTNSICEVRLRADMPVVLVFTDGMYYITKSRRITRFNGSDLLSVDKNALKDIFALMCRFSVYSYTDQISKGFISLSEGVRVGVYGTAVTENNKINSVRNIRGLNIRIPSVCFGCSSEICELFRNGKIPNLVICGPPSSGKTTVLKDLCRALSDSFNKRVCVIDERFEFEAEYTGVNTDILSGYPKNFGIEIAVRSLSPEVIVLDEIGMNGEAEKIIECMNSGVSFIMSMHGTDRDELIRKNQFRLLVDSGVVEYCAFLKEKSAVKEIISVKEIINENYSTDYIRALSGSDRTVFLPEASKKG